MMRRVGVPGSAKMWHRGSCVLQAIGFSVYQWKSRVTVEFEVEEWGPCTQTVEELDLDSRRLNEQAEQPAAAEQPPPQAAASDELPATAEEREGDAPPAAASAHRRSLAASIKEEGVFCWPSNGESAITCDNPGGLCGACNGFGFISYEECVAKCENNEIAPNCEAFQCAS